MTNLIDFRVTDLVTQVLAAQYNRVIDAALRGELSNTETLAANRTLVDADFALQVYAPTAARDVTLPAVAATNHPFYIYNASGTYSLTIKNAGGSTITTISPLASSMCVSTGAAWYPLSGGNTADATTTSKGSVKLANQLGGTADLPTVKGITELGATELTFGSVPDGSFLQRSGTSIAGSVANFYPYSGWVPAGVLWNYASATTFTIFGNYTDLYTKGMRIRFGQPGDKYGVVLSSSYAAPNTTVTLVTNSDYSIANSTIYTPMYSFMDNPQGWPGWFSYTATLAGFSADPTFTTKYNIRGKTCHLNHFESANGTSNATNFTVSLPVNAASSGFSPATVRASVYDNGSASNGGSVQISASASVATLLLSANASGWTASAGKRGSFQILYEW